MSPFSLYRYLVSYKLGQNLIKNNILWPSDHWLYRPLVEKFLLYRFELTLQSNSSFPAPRLYLAAHAHQSL